MRQRDYQFAVVFERLTPTLTRFFSNVIRRYGGDRESKADILVQVVAEQALVDSRREHFANYTIEVLIWLKAGNVASAYVQSSRKRATTSKTASGLIADIIGPVQYLSFQEVQDYLFKYADQLTWQICSLIRDGWSYNQIAQVLDLTEEIIVMRIYRLEQELKQRDTRPD
jgi:hypothetical protein